MPPSPKIFSIFLVELNTRNTKIRFKTKAITIFSVAYSARKESSAVKEPGPATNGKASSTIAALPSGP